LAANKCLLLLAKKKSRSEPPPYRWPISGNLPGGVGKFLEISGNFHFHGNFRELKSKKYITIIKKYIYILTTLGAP
jgi:hypothetical protein